MKRIIGFWALLACCLFFGVTTARALTPEEQCLSKRDKAKGKYEKCVQNWLARCSAHRDPAHCGNVKKLSKCVEKYAAVWPKLQTLSGTTCAMPRWEDNGLTVTDYLTGLIWEKKTDDGSVHDVDSEYRFTDTSDGDMTDEDGTVFTAFLSSLNSGGFAGANGWRMPTFAELMTIFLPGPYPCTEDPCIDAVFGPTESYFYRSSTTVGYLPHFSFVANFRLGVGEFIDKDSSTPVRAVRGGL